MISIRPITSRLVSRAFNTYFVHAAEQSIEVAPAVSYKVEAPIMLADEADRIQAHHYDCDPVLNCQRLKRRVMTVGATSIHLVRDVIVADGTLLTRKSVDRVAPGKKRYVIYGDAERIDEGAICSTHLAHRYFGHWIREGTVVEELAAELGLQSVVVDAPPYMHEPSYRNLLGLHPRRTSLAWFDRLWVPLDGRFNSHFVRRHDRLRDRLRERVGASETPSDRVFISRGNSGTGRRLANEAEVRDALGSRGFTLLDPERTDAAEIARVLSNARLVVSPEGSALAHAPIAMKRGAGLIAIMGAQHFNMPYKDICDALGFFFGLTIAGAVDADQYSQPIDRLLRTIDLVDKAVDTAPAPALVQ